MSNAIWRITRLNLLSDLIYVVCAHRPHVFFLLRFIAKLLLMVGADVKSQCTRKEKLKHLVGRDKYFAEIRK